MSQTHVLIQAITFPEDTHCEMSFWRYLLLQKHAKCRVFIIGPPQDCTIEEAIYILVQFCSTVSETQGLAETHKQWE